MKLETLQKKLEAAGLDVRPIQMVKERDAITGERVTCEALRVLHDYRGLYPTSEAMQKRAKAVNIARRYGFREEQRGYYTATFIYAE